MEQARRVWRLIQEDFARVFEQQADVLLTPVVAQPAARGRELEMGDVRTRAFTDDVCTSAVNLAGALAGRARLSNMWVNVVSAVRLCACRSAGGRRACGHVARRPPALRATHRAPIRRGAAAESRVRARARHQISGSAPLSSCTTDATLETLINLCSSIIINIVLLIVQKSYYMIYEYTYVCMYNMCYRNMYTCTVSTKYTIHYSKIIIQIHN